MWPTDVKVRRGLGWQLRHRKGEYNPFNRWNTTHGAMHLTHPANTLAAEIRLAADGTVVRSRAAGRCTDRGRADLLRRLRRPEPLERPDDRRRG